MDKVAIDIAKALMRLSALTVFELRGEWRRLHRMPPPMRLSRDLLVRGITYKLQERAYGGSAGPRATKIGVVSLKALDHHRPNREEFRCSTVELSPTPLPAKSLEK